MRTRKLAVETGQQEILYLHDGQNPVDEAAKHRIPRYGVQLILNLIHRSPFDS
jgi:hypothetical protein